MAKQKIAGTGNTGSGLEGKHHLGRVVNRRDMPGQFVWLELQVEDLGSVRAGQFVVVHCADPQDHSAGIQWANQPGWPEPKAAELRSRVALLRRPFSIADLSGGAKGCRLGLQFRVLGPGTSWLGKNARVGSYLRLVGPLGNGFELSDVRQAVLVAGGMGVAPMMFLARELRRQDSQVVLLVGARNRELLPLSPSEGAIIDEEGEPSLCCQDYSDLGVMVGINTDDGSLGRVGPVSDATADYLARHRELLQTGTMIYTCGPEVMMAKVVQVAQSQGLPVQVCMERYMACGLGACQSCVCRQKSEQDQDGWTYKLVCADGPIFDGHGIIWQENGTLICE